MINVYTNADHYYEQAQRRTDARIIGQADAVYFLGLGTACFWHRAPLVASKLSNFSGLIGGFEAKKLREYGRLNFLKPNSDIINIEEIDRSKKTVLIDFNEGLTGRLFSESLETQFAVVNWLQATHDLDLPHTYLPLKIEREETYKNIDWFQQIDAMLADDFSRNTLRARLQSLLSMNPFYLQRFQTVSGIVQERNSHDHPICVSENEDFVDVGAYNGDTVRQFVNSADGKYASITAYEPDKRSFKTLSHWCDKLPRAEAYNYAVSDFSGEVSFFEDEKNSQGSHIQGNASLKQKAEVRSCVKLDDHLKEMSLLAIDVEGYELNVIEGAEGLIGLFEPKMHISAYHYPLDIPKLVAKLAPMSNRKLFLRHQHSTLYDTNLIVA
jgi:FkbM family methyltransferase